mgnify:CR=1 FL=1
MVNIGNDWDEILKGEFEKEYYQDMRKFLVKEYKTKTIYPKPEEIFSAFKLTSYKDCKIVLLGQDPYHGPNQAHGLAFSVKEGVKLPPSLQNIYKEISSEYGYNMSKNGYLVPWAKQGVLLLNTARFSSRAWAVSLRLALSILYIFKIFTILGITSQYSSKIGCKISPSTSHSELGNKCIGY